MNRGSQLSGDGQLNAITFITNTFKSAMCPLTMMKIYFISRFLAIMDASNIYNNQILKGEGKFEEKHDCNYSKKHALGKKYALERKFRKK